MFTLSLQPEFFNKIESGKKTVEGRLNRPKFKDIAVGSEIKFINSESLDEVICRAIAVNRYKDFRSMLIAEGVKNMLPGIIDGIDEAVRLYESFPSYKSDVEIFGAVVIKIELISSL